jgi:hypothetical protein
MSESLIRRLQKRIRAEPTVDWVNVSPPIRPRLPVSEQVIAQAEAELGFPLPPLLRALYTRVAGPLPTVCGGPPRSSAKCLAMCLWMTPTRPRCFAR